MLKVQFVRTVDSMDSVSLAGRDCDRSKVALLALMPGGFPLVGESLGICAISGFLKSRYPGLHVLLFDQQLHDLQEVVKVIDRERPVLLGVSAKHGTFSQLQELHRLLQTTIPQDRRPAVVAGNAVAALGGTTALQRVFPDLQVATGEGEITMADLYEHVQGRLPLRRVRNLLSSSGGPQDGAKEYLDPRLIAAPDRCHTLAFSSAGGEIYVEGSRGCAYGMCSFCTGSDVLGSRTRSVRWRPRPLEAIVRDLRCLTDLGVGVVTFADEDFFGPGVDGLRRAQRLAREIVSAGIRIRFRINARARSVSGSTGDEALNAEGEKTIQLLKQAGLCKVAMGLESGVASQLARYRKGIRLEQFNAAFRLMRRHGIECEFGFILIDPLMTLEELKQALEFLRRHGYVTVVSAVYKELRVQVGSPYVDQVREVEEARQVRILGEIDLESQEHEVVSHVDPSIAFIVSIMSPWSDLMYRLFYALRVLTQYPAQAAMRPDVSRSAQHICFQAIRELREIEFRLLTDLVRLLEEQGRDRGLASELCRRNELARRNVVARLLDTIVAAPADRHVRLSAEANTYLQRSTEFLAQLNRAGAIGLRREPLHVHQA